MRPIIEDGEQTQNQIISRSVSFEERHPQDQVRLFRESP